MGWGEGVVEAGGHLFIFFVFNIYLFIYLAAPGLSCGTRDL